MMKEKENYLNLIKEHYCNVWGDKPTIRHWMKGPYKELPNGFCILEFAPRKERPMWTYASCGMSEVSDIQPIELHLFSPFQSSSLNELLTIIAHYQNEVKSLNVGHSINFGRPWLEDSLCTYGLISLPYLDGPELENFSIHNKRVKFFWLIPVTKEEIEYKKSKGLDALEQLFESKRINYLDINRASLV